VAHLEEAALLNVGPESRREGGADRAAADELVGEVQPLDAAVFQGLAGGLGAADRIAA